jgi:chromosome segregation ATPase
MATNALSPTSQTTNGDVHDLPPPAPAAKKGKAKKDKQLSAEENAKLVQQRLSQLEQEKAGDKAQQAEIDREVKKAIRDLNELVNGVEPLKAIDTLKTRYEDLLAEMKKTEREHVKAKKARDQYQKEADKSKSEGSKTATMKDKLEKLCRELTKENKKLKEDNKKLEESEKVARVTVNDRLDAMLYEVQDAMNSKTATHGEHLHMELDEL